MRLFCGQDVNFSAWQVSYFYAKLKPMKPIIYILISSLLLLAVFGFVGMLMQMGNGHGGCLAVQVRGFNCPNNPIAFLNFHAEALKIFSTAVFSYSFNSLFIFFSLLTFFSVLFFRQIFQAEQKRTRVLVKKKETSFASSPLRRSISRWLSIHENSPSLFLALK